MNTSKVLGAAALALLVTTTAAQGGNERRLGPKDRDTILDARLDPSYASTPLARVVFLPFGNELDYQEGAMFLAQNFVSEMRQKHAEMAIVPPHETSELIRGSGLAEDYRVFLGNYINTGVATQSFLQALGRAGKVDGILLGEVLGFGVKSDKYSMITSFGVITWKKNRAFVGMEIKLLRAKDGRELWWGAHGVQGEKNENVRDLAKLVGTVFATFFGRVPY